VLLGLRLDEPVPLSGLDETIDADAVARLEGLGLAERRRTSLGAPGLALTARGRVVGGRVTADLLA
jgi:hypothetical protein